jgi:hypothetical protein
MVRPSIFDFIVGLKHQPNGYRIPWLESRSAERMVSIPASILALHVPSANSSGTGHFLVTEGREAAFITSGGVCWDIGALDSAIDAIHEGQDGSVQVFLSRPTSLHVTVARAEADDFLRVLSGAPSPPKAHEAADREKEDRMALFGRKKSDENEPILAFPAGQAPPPGVSVKAFLVQQALGKGWDSAIPSEDLMAYADAGYANVLGIPDNDLILAWGPARIHAPQDDKERDATVVVTANTMLAYWQPGRTSLIHTFQANHSAVTGAVPQTPTGVVIQWQVAEFANNQGKFIVGEPAVSLTPRYGRDGHANRRALTWYVTLLSLIGMDEGGGPAFDDNQGSGAGGGFGSGGTKL